MLPPRDQRVVCPMVDCLEGVAVRVVVRTGVLAGTTTLLCEACARRAAGLLLGREDFALYPLDLEQPAAA